MSRLLAPARRIAVSLIASVALVTWTAGCEEAEVVGAPPPATPGGGAVVTPAGAAADEADAGPGGLSFEDDAFVESDRHRDPFRAFAELFKVRNTVAPQRAVVMPTTGIDEMRLVAIISGVPRPQAMLVDPLGVGHVVQRGDYVGRPEVVQTGDVQGLAVPLNWRVDRIRAGEVVLVREDQTGSQPLTRVLPLYEEGETRP